MKTESQEPMELKQNNLLFTIAGTALLASCTGTEKTVNTKPLNIVYIMTDDQRRFVREKIFPYWKGKSLEEAFLARLPAEPRPV